MNLQNFVIALVLLLSNYTGESFEQTASQVSSILNKTKGQEITTDIRIEAGNAYNEEYATSGLPNIPTSWGPTSTAVVVNAVNGGAGRGRTGLNNLTGYNIQGSLYVINHNQNAGEFVSVHVGKIISNIQYTQATVAATHYMQLANVGGSMKIQIKYPTMSGEVTDTCPTTLVLNQPYDFLIEYNIIGNYLRLSFNNQICTNFTLDAISSRSIGTLVLGSSGGSTGRNVAYLIDNLIETPIPHEGLPPTATVTSPTNGATNVDITAPIVCGGQRANSYEVALSTSNPPTNFVTLGVGVNIYNPEPMVSNTVYFVRCRNTNSNGTTTSAVSSFTTRATPQTGPHATPLKLTAARLTKLAQMRTDYLADTTCASYSNQQRMACDNWRLLLRVAGQQDGEWEFGHNSAMLARVTGESASTHCNNAWLRAKSTYTPGAPFQADALTTPNTRREFMIDQIEIYDWCYPSWTQARRDEYLARLNEIVKRDFDAYASTFRCADVDQHINTYFAVAALYASTGTYNPIAATMWNSASVGGLTASAIVCNPSTAAGHTLRNAVGYHYSTAFAGGGAWPEGTDYGLGSPYLGIWGCESVRPILGNSPCTEIDAWVDDYARWFTNMITRDSKHFAQVGDNAHPRQLLCCHVHAGAINNIHVLTGLLPDASDRQHLMRALLNLRTQYGGAFNPTGGSPFGVDAYRSSRSLALADLYATAASDFSGISKCYQSAAYGVNIYNNGSGSTASQFWIQFWPDMRYIDHGHEGFGNFKWYRRGDWPADSPASYAGTSLIPEGMNQISVEGLGAFPTRLPNGSGPQYKHVSGITCGTDYMVVSGTQGGLYQTERDYDNQPIYYDPPPVFNHETTRSAFVKVPSSGTYEWALIEDRVNAVNPESLIKFDRYGGNTCYLVTCVSDLAYMNARSQRIQASPRWTDYQFHNTNPTIAGTSTTWTLADGQQVARTWLAPTTITSTKAVLSTLPQFNCALTPVRADVSQCAEPAAQTWSRTVTVSSLADTQWNYLARIIVVKNSSSITSPTITTLTPTNNCAGVLVSHPSDNDTVVISNAAQGTGFAATVLYPTAAQAQAVLATARYRTAGACSTTYVQTTASATVVFKDLNPTLSWSYTLDGGGSVPLTEDSSGVAQITVPTATTHTIVLTGV